MQNLTPTQSPSAGVPALAKRGVCEPLARSMSTILNKMGRFSPERQEEIDRAIKSESKKTHMLEVRKLRAGSGLRRMFEGARLDDVEYARVRLTPEEMTRYLYTRDQLKTLLDWWGILILQGENGPGKSHLACMLVNEFIERERPAHYCRSVDFFNALKSTFGVPGKTSDDLIRRYEGYELLVMDEYEVRSNNDWENVTLRSLIDARYADWRATVIITNKGINDLAGYFGPAICSRISQGGCILPCDWPSLRGEK